MTGSNEFRADLIPSGHCVTPDEQDSSAIPEVFDYIDHGEATATRLLLAKEACKTCVQFSYCNDQRDDLAVELWQRGAGFAVIGGEQLNATIKMARPTALEVPVKAFTFDLTEIPQEPELALAILRQAWRSGQLTVGGPTPKAVKEVSGVYTAWLKEHSPKTYRSISETLGVAEMSKGAEHIITALFQQKDFGDYSKGKRKSNRSAKPRYDAKNLDIGAEEPTITRFLQDAADIKRAGYSAPAKKATLYDPEFYKSLAVTYHQGMSWTDFDKIISENRRNPISALQEHQIRRSTIRKANPSASEAYIRTAARVRKDGSVSETVAQMTEEFKDYEFVTEGLVRSLCTTNPGSPQEALRSMVSRVESATEIYGNDPVVTSSDIVQLARNYRSTEKLLEVIELFKTNVTTLQEKYARDPSITTSFIRNFSNRHLYNAAEAVDAYKHCLDLLTTTSDGSVPRSALRSAARSGISSFREAQRLHMQKMLHQRFMQRAQARDEKRPDLPVIERITQLYPYAETNVAAEGAYRLINSSIVVEANADAPILHGDMPNDLRKIFSPKSRSYLTFSSEMSGLSHLQRLVIAHQHGLMPALYGCEANPLRLTTLLNGKSISDYYHETVLPLIAERDKTVSMPLALGEIFNDYHYFQQVLRADTHELPRDVLQLRNLRDTTLVVAGKALYMNEPGYNWEWDATLPDLYPWLEQKIIATHAPHQREAAFDHAREAIQSGALELLGSSPQDFRLVLSPTFYQENVSDLQRAAVANAMGVDRLIFGSDLTMLLRQRLGSDPVTIVVNRGTTNPSMIESPTEQLTEQAAQEAREEVAHAAEELPLPEEPLDRLLTYIFGPQPSLSALPDKQRQKIASTLLAVFGSHMKTARDQGNNYPDDQQAIFLAWSAVQHNDLRSAANTYGLSHDQIDNAVYHGLESIGAILGELHNQRLTDIRTALEKAGTFGFTVTEENPMPPAHEDKPHEAFPTASAVKSIVRTTNQESPDIAEPELAISDVSESPTAGFMYDPFDNKEDTTDANTTIEETSLPADTASLYFKAVRQYPLLNAAQEVSLSQAIEAGVFAQEKLDNSTYDPADKEDLERLAVIGQQAKEKMVNSNLRLVLKIAKKYAPHVGPSMSYMDLVQYGNQGLIRAVEKFDYKKGYKFSTYATNWINQSMSRGRQDDDYTMRIPVHVQGAAFADIRYKRQRLAETGIEPTTEEVAQYLNITSQQLVNARDALRKQPLSFHTPLGVDGDDELVDTIEDVSQEQPEQIVVANVAREALQRVMGEMLTGRGRLGALVLILNEGLDHNPAIIDATMAREIGAVPGKSYTLDEITQMLDLPSREAARRERQVVRDMLRHPSIRNRLIGVLRD